MVHCGTWERCDERDICSPCAEMTTRRHPQLRGAGDEAGREGNALDPAATRLRAGSRGVPPECEPEGDRDPAGGLSVARVGPDRPVPYRRAAAPVLIDVDRLRDHGDKRRPVGSAQARENHVAAPTGWGRPGARRQHVTAENADRRGPYLVTVPQAARLLSVSVRMVFKLIAEGALPAVRLGRATRIAGPDILNLIDSHRTPQSPDDRVDGVPRSPDSRRRLVTNLPADWPRLPYTPRGRRVLPGNRN